MLTFEILIKIDTNEWLNYVQKNDFTVSMFLTFLVC